MKLYTLMADEGGIEYVYCTSIHKSVVEETLKRCLEVPLKPYLEPFYKIVEHELHDESSPPDLTFIFFDNGSYDDYKNGHDWHIEVMPHDDDFDPVWSDCVTYVIKAHTIAEAKAKLLEQEGITIND